jgi:serine/threonine-protein kinase
MDIVTVIGKTISHYTILEKLGEGGMGIVYKAQDKKLGRDVALKFLPAHLHTSEEDISRFRQEAKTISTLNHPHIATIYDIDETDNQKFLVLEYLHGGTLKSKLTSLRDEGKQFTIRQVVEYGLQAAEGLAHAHRHGIIHRDVKTDNVMLTEEENVKITDFGLAKFAGGAQVTKPGKVVGTAAYMSPEQIRGEEIDHRSDLFSFGVMLYELVTGQLPFRGEHEAALAYSIVHETPHFLLSLRPDIPPMLENVILRCLEKEKEKRFQSAEDIVHDLQKTRQSLLGYAVTSLVASRKYSKFIWASAIVTVLAFVVVYFFFSRETSTKSIAVLPFKNLSNEAGNDYFSEGITEDVIARLAKISNLKVISRTSVMFYKNSEKKLKEIGEELDVNTILEGSVRREGNQVRIVAQLIDAVSDEHIWAETYDEELTQIFSIQKDVAEKIAKALEATISSREKERLKKPPTEILEAYDAYLQGRFYWNKRLPKDVTKGIEYFQQALEKDSSYALAYTGLADAYIILGDFNILPPTETYPKAKAAALRALEIDPMLPEAHLSLAYSMMHYDWNWPGAEKEFKTTIQLMPNSAQAHSWYALFLAINGRFEEAIAESKRAQELDPQSAVIQTDGGMVFYFARKYELCIERLTAVLKMDPTFVLANIPLGGAYIQKKMYPEAMNAFSTLSMASAVVASKSHPIPIAGLAHVYAVSGRKDDALNLLELLDEKSKDEYVAPYWMSIIYVGLERNDEAFTWLEQAYQERDGSMMFLNVEPLFDPLRQDQRFTMLLKGMGY